MKVTKTNMKQVELEPGEASRRLHFEMAIANLPPIDTNSPEEVNQRLNYYFSMCENEDMKPTVPGMCNALGIARQTLRAWFTGEKHKDDTVMFVVEKYYNMLNAFTEGLMYDGKVNPVVGIFAEKNHWQYKDQAETIVKHENLLGVQRSAAEIRQKYLANSTKSLPTMEECDEVVTDYGGADGQNG